MCLPMIRLPFFSQFKNKWLQRMEAQLKREHAQRIAELLDQQTSARQQLNEELTQQLHTLQDELKKRIVAAEHKLVIEAETLALREQQLKDRQLEAQRKAEELTHQIRLLEAKASPDQVWTNAFSLGFSKAWDMMYPLMQQGFGKSYDLILNDACEKTLQGLEQAIQHRIEQAKDMKLKHANEVIMKQQEFLQKREQARTPLERDKYEHYLQALEWAMSPNGY